MPRHRMVRYDFWLEEPIINCSHSARLLFIGLANFADDNGVHPASYILAKAEVFPADSCSIDDVKQWITELINNSLLREYAIEGKFYWLIIDWKRRQKIDRPTYKYPLPYNELKELPVMPRLDNDLMNTQRELDVHSTSPRRAIDDSSIFSDCNIRGEDIREDKERDIVVSTADSRTPMFSQNCPQEEIKALYHEILSMCPKVRVWNETRRRYLQQRWREDPKHQTLEFWRWYFGYVKESKFLTGQVARREGRAPFLANLAWLTKPENFAKVIEGNYHRE